MPDAYPLPAASPPYRPANPALPRYACAALLFVCVLCVFVPLSPRMPVPGLDPSWQWALNQAISQGLVTGTDIVFTFGPYAPVFTTMYHPATDSMMVAATLYLGISYFIGIMRLSAHRSFPYLLLVCVVFLGVLTSRDALLLSFAPLAGLVALEHQTLAPSDREKASWDLLTLAVLFIPLGLLPLVKGSLLLPCATTAALSALWFATQGNTRAALICLIGPGAALGAFWLLSGAPIAALPAYLLHMKSIISGYTEAMANMGPTREIAAYVLGAVMVIGVIAVRHANEPRKSIFIGTLFAAISFVTFKAAFVRHDAWHTPIATNYLWLTSLMVLLVSRTSAAWTALAATVLAWALIGYTNHSTWHVERQLTRSVVDAASGLVQRLTDPESLNRRFDLATAKIRAEVLLPRVDGTSDLYSYDQAYLLASNNTWAPRPVFQSYSAYEPELAEMNRRHLIGPEAPANIFISISTIDGRLPMLDDGSSWPILLTDYAPVATVQNFLQLRRKDAVLQPAATHDIGTIEGHLGEAVTLPPDVRTVFVRMDVQPTWLGRIAGVLFKLPELEIQMLSADGRTSTYRFIAEMARSRFILSPLVTRTEDFAELYGAAESPLTRRVQKFTILASRLGSWFWKPQYAVTFASLQP